MNTLLILGNTTTEGKSLLELFKKKENTLTVLNAIDEISAQAILSSTTIDLIIFNLNLSDLQNLKILLKITSSYPYIPCIAITNTAQEAMRYGASYCLKSPFESAKLLYHVSKFLNLETHGILTGIPVHSFLQMLEGEEKNCTLRVSISDETGHLYIREGELIGGDTTELKGEEAIYKIITWENPVIEMKFLNPRRKKDIDKPLIYLIMEAYRIKDEREKTKEPDKTATNSWSLQHISTIGNPVPLELGMQLKIDRGRSHDGLICSLIGVIPQTHLIISSSQSLNKYLRTKERITIKFIHMGRLCMFKTELVSSVAHPHQLLFLDYPKVLHYREMRKSKRISIETPCNLFTQEGDIHKGNLEELSGTGCLYSTKKKDNPTLQSAEVNFEITLIFQLPNHDKPTTHLGRIINIHTTSEKIKFGIVFLDPLTDIVEFLERNVMNTSIL